MQFISSKYLILATVAVALFGPASAAEMTDEELIKNAMSAAPEAVGSNATVVKFDAQMQMTTLKEGTNGFTCIPDDPTTPTNDPLCADAAGMAWIQAIATKEQPPAGKVGFIYMLQGGSGMSNADPYATEPVGGKWQEDGPHVMIVNAMDMLAMYPQMAENPDTTQPYVMFPGTPYAHLMFPTP